MLLEAICLDRACKDKVSIWMMLESVHNVIAFNYIFRFCIRISVSRYFLTIKQSHLWFFDRDCWWFLKWLLVACALDYRTFFLFLRTETEFWWCVRSLTLFLLLISFFLETIVTTWLLSCLVFKLWNLANTFEWKTLIWSLFSKNMIEEWKFLPAFPLSYAWICCASDCSESESLCEPAAVRNFDAKVPFLIEGYSD